MTIVEAVASTKLTPGVSVPPKLSAGNVSLALTGDAIASETDGTVNIEVSGPPNPRVFALLKAGPTLIVPARRGRSRWAGRERRGAVSQRSRGCVSSSARPT